MNNIFKYALLITAQVFLVGSSGCAPADTTRVASTATSTSATSNAAPSVPRPSPQINASPQTSPEPAATPEALALPLTLPVLDAFFADDTFGSDLKTKLQLNDDQIRQLRQVARGATSKLKEGDGNRGTTTEASAKATESIKTIIGDEKARLLAELVRTRWKGNEKPEDSMAGATREPGGRATAAGPSGDQKVNGTPSDSRIVVNTPAYRMDIFEEGRLVKSYKVAIGYPEFPLPSGLRKATTIIFNPTWTPPDSPWVATMKNVTAGEKVEAGSKLNPLGPIKIPIGMPSLIHGGKSPAKIGGFGSHGCVGLTNAQVGDFAKQLGEISGTRVTDADIAAFARNKSHTKEVKLNSPVPVELRYQTIVVEDGKLHIYRDVYDKGTNTEQNLRAVLDSYGVTLDQINEKERGQALDALKQMSRNAAGKPAGKGGKRNRDSDPESATVTRTVRGKKEIVVDISELSGKGYPAPVNLDSGTPARSPARRAAPTRKTRPIASKAGASNGL